MLPPSGEAVLCSYTKQPVVTSMSGGPRCTMASRLCFNFVSHYVSLIFTWVIAALRRLYWSISEKQRLVWSYKLNSQHDVVPSLCDGDLKQECCKQGALVLILGVTEDLKVLMSWRCESHLWSLGGTGVSTAWSLQWHCGNACTPTTASAESERPAAAEPGGGAQEEERPGRTPPAETWLQRNDNT